MRIPLLYRGEYSQWRERFMNYLEEQMDGKAMINSIHNGDQPLPTAEEKKTRKINRFTRSLLIQGLPNDIYSLIDSNKTAKDLWDALERQMRGFEYGEQDRKAAILYEYETFKAPEGEQLLDTYLRYLQVINDLNKCGYKKDNYELNYKFLNNLQPEWKQYGTLMRQTKNLMDINIDASYNILKQNQGDVNDALGYKKKAVVVTSNPLALVIEKTKVSKRKEKAEVQTESKGSNDEDISDLKKIIALFAKAFNRKKYYAKPTNNNLRTSSASSSANKKPEYVKSVENKEDKKADEKKRDMNYNYYKTKMLLAKKDSDKQVLLAEDQAWMESSGDSDQEINANMVFMAQFKKVLSDSYESSSSAEETIVEKHIEKANQQTKDLENQNKDLQDKYDVLINQVNTFEEQNNELNEQMKVLNERNANLLTQTEVLQDQLKVKHVVFYTHTECQAQHAKLEEERYEYMIRYSALCDNDKQHRKKIDEQEILFDKISFQLVEMNNNVLRLQEKILEKETKILELEGFRDSFDENNLFIFDNESVRISPVSKIHFWKNPCDSMNVRSKSTSNKSLPRTVHRWLLKMQPLAELVAKWIPRVERQFLGTVRISNNDFAVIAGYGDVVIGSMTIKKVYYVEGLGHNLFSVGQFCDKGLEVAFRKSTCFVRNEDGVDLLTGDRSSNLYTISLNEVASNSSTCLLAKASSSQSWLTPQQNGVVERRNRTLVEAARSMLTFANLPLFLWTEAIAIACFTQNRSIIHKRFDKTPYELMNKRKPNIKFFRVFGCRCYLLNDNEDVGKLKAKGDIGVFVGYSKESAASRERECKF
nr:integrase, catalytic region, zinc finger, CCHC-type, peptidase aspartic, catalytic [Tanacetum cinerariifolium]